MAEAPEERVKQYENKIKQLESVLNRDGVQHIV